MWMRWWLCGGTVPTVECFQRAVLDADSQLRLIHMFGAVISGSQVNFCFLLRCHFESTVCWRTFLLHSRDGVQSNPVFISVCMSVQWHISTTTCPYFSVFSVRYMWPWLLSALTTMQHIMYFQLCGDVTFSHNEANTSTDLETVTQQMIHCDSPGGTTDWHRS